MNKKDIIIDYNLDKNGNKTLKHIDIITKSHPIEPVILLPQIPNEFNKIEVIFNNKHLIRVDKIRDLDNADKIYIDYSKQKIYIHKDLMHKDLKVRYSGIGALKFDINNINYNQEDKLSIIESIDKVANNGEKIFEECLSEGFADKQEVLNELLTKIALGNKSIKDIDNVIKNIDLDNIANNMTNSTTKIDNIEQEIVKARSNKSNVKTRLDIQENNINECKDELNGINDRISLITINIENLTINIGDLALLKTKNKKNIVEALNELAKKVGIIVTPPEPPIVEPTKWVAKSSMPTARSNFAIELVNNYIYVIGGRAEKINNECYNILSNEWITKANLSFSRDCLGSAVVGNKIYLISGLKNGSSLGGELISDNIAYDTETNTYITKTPIPTPRWGMGCVSVGTNIYCLGGTTNMYGDVKTYKVEIYNTLTDIWSNGVSMPFKADSLMCCTVGDKIYILGCVGKYETVSKTVYCFDTTTNSWSRKADMPVNLSGAGCCAIGNKIYLIGGASDNNVLDTVYCYDTITDEWSIKASMLTARKNLKCIAINGKIYAIGGENNTTKFALNEVFE